MRVVIFLLMLLPLAVAAQPDLSAQRASLERIGPITTDITVEGPRHLVESDDLRTEVLLHRIVHRIRESGIDVQRDARSATDKSPLLHIHVNLLDLEGGLVPFSVSAEFFQNVRLTHSGREMAAVTWSESVLGLVSPDLVANIPKSVDGLVDQFIDDVAAANEE